MNSIPTLHLVILIAATWRLANLLANEDGPFHFVKTLRSKIARAEVRSRRRNGLLSRAHLYEGVNCEYCNSIWFGTLLGWPYLYFSGAHVPFVIALIFPLALSTGAILIKHVVYLVKSVDTRFDQQNQLHIKQQEDAKKVGEVTHFQKVEAVKQTLVERR